MKRVASATERDMLDSRSLGGVEVQRCTAVERWARCECKCRKDFSAAEFEVVTA